MDSRQYIFIYPLKTNADIPADFPPEFRGLPFETGIFLPQDDSNWFTRSQQYPARLLLLERRSLYIVPHPSSTQSPVELKLDDLVQIETGCILLLGWMEFRTCSEVQHLVYNTRGSRPLETFLGVLKRRWLENAPAPSQACTDTYGDELDIKFRNSVHQELHPHEAALAQYFQAPALFQKRILFFKRQDWRAGNVLLLTSMNRLVWITDHYRRRRELYASISHSVPSRLFQECRSETNTANQLQLVLLFHSGLSWRIPIVRAPEQCALFCERLKQFPMRSGSLAFPASEPLEARPEVIRDHRADPRATQSHSNAE